MRRCQQFELYAAERRVSTGRTFSSIDEVTRWVNALRDTYWWEHWYRNVHVIEVTRSQDASASVGAWEPEENLAIIAMLPVHMNEQSILHELAHPLAEARFDAKSHDPFFARVYLELTYLVRGTKAWHELLAAFTQDGIEVDTTDEAEMHRRRMLGEIE